MKGGRTAPRNSYEHHLHGHESDSSMKGGRTAPRNFHRKLDELLYRASSMKGGRTAPRNFSDRPARSRNAGIFNEGGADCPPKLRRGCLVLQRFLSLQ